MENFVNRTLERIEYAAGMESVEAVVTLFAIQDMLGDLFYCELLDLKSYRKLADEITTTMWKVIDSEG